MTAIPALIASGETSGCVMPISGMTNPNMGMIEVCEKWGLTPFFPRVNQNTNRGQTPVLSRNPAFNSLVENWGQTPVFELHIGAN